MARRSRSVWEWLSIVALIVITITFLVFLGIEIYYAATATQDTIILFHTQVILAILQGASLLFLVVYVIKTWEMASATRQSAEVAEKTIQEMQEARDQETAPYVVLYFDIPYGQMLMYLVVKNIGRSTAHDIRFEIDPPLAVSWEPLPDLPFGQAEKIIGSLPPNGEIRTLFDETEYYFTQNLPLRYSIRTFFTGGMQTGTRMNEQILDLSAYAKVKWIVEDRTKESREAKSLNLFRMDLINELKIISMTLRQAVYGNQSSEQVDNKKQHSNPLRKILQNIIGNKLK
jgi:hypothetical protein